MIEDLGAGRFVGLLAGWLALGAVVCLIYDMVRGK